jgi:hypothetical protein
LNVVFHLFIITSVCTKKQSRFVTIVDWNAEADEEPASATCPEIQTHVQRGTATGEHHANCTNSHTNSPEQERLNMEPRNKQVCDLPFVLNRPESMI